MEPLLWLLLPVAAASGWLTARFSHKRSSREATKGPSRQVSQQCIQGLNYLLSDQSDKAIETFVGLVEVDEDTVETHLILGSLFRNRGEVDRAIRIHQNIIARPNLSSAQKSNALLQLGIDHFKAGLLDRAENIFLQLAESGNRNPRLYEYLCRLYEQEREWEKAIAAARSLLRYDRKDQRSRIAHYYCQRVEELGPRGFEQALQYTRDALAADPDCVRALLQQGDIFALRGKTKDAVKSYRCALKRNQYYSPIVLNRLFRLYRETGRLDQFPDFVRENADLKNDGAARFFTAHCYETLGKREQLESLLAEEMQREEPSPHIVRTYLESMRRKTEGDIQQSFSTLSRVLETRLGQYMACHCTQCGFESNALFWQCPSCNSWGTVRPYQNPVEYSWLDATE